MNTVHILDPGLYLSVGHHLDYDKSVSSEFQKFGFKPILFCNRIVWDPIILNDATPAFTYNLYGRFPQAEVEERLSIHIKELTEISSYANNHSGICFFPNVGLLDVKAITKSHDFVSKYKSLHLILRYDNIAQAFTDDIDTTELYRSALSEIYARYNNIHLYTDTLALKARWKSLRINTDLVPIPIDHGISFHEPSISKQFYIASLGQSSPEKGLDLVINVLLCLASIGFNPPCFVQTTFHTVPDKIVQSLPNVVFNNTPLSRERYNDILHNSNYYLNFFNPDKFKFGSSNTLLEAIVAGCVPLCSDYSFARATLGELSDDLIVDMEPVPIAKRLLALNNEFLAGSPTELAYKLQKASSILRTLHGPSRLVENILLNHG